MKSLTEFGSSLAKLLYMHSFGPSKSTSVAVDDLLAVPHATFTNLPQEHARHLSEDGKCPLKPDKYAGDKYISGENALDDVS